MGLSDYINLSSKNGINWLHKGRLKKITNEILVPTMGLSDYINLSSKNGINWLHKGRLKKISPLNYKN